MRIIFLPLVAIASMLSADAATFVVSNVNESGPGSLHQAITDANAARGHDEILFNIAGAGVHKIDIQRLGLPEIIDPVTIDGYTQAGARPNTLSIGNDAVILIQIDGADNYRTGPVNGLVISGGDSVIRGLSITGIPARIYLGIPEDPPPPPPEGDAILLKGNGGNVIEGNYIGFAPNGEPVEYGAYIGIEILSNDNRIGGPAPASRNLLARHENALVVRGAGTIIQGNYIGTDRSGQAPARWAMGIGLIVSGNDFLIGGTQPGCGNVISGNRRGIIIQAPATGGTIHGNLIGRAADGVTILENGHEPDILTSGSRTLIGGLEPGAPNVFGAGYESVRVRQANAASPAVGNAILSNVYFRPSNWKILLGATGNDLGDRDSGPNNLQNHPVVTEVRRSENSTRVVGGLNSTPSITFLLQFYANPFITGEGQFLGTETVTTDRSGMAWFDFAFPVKIPERAEVVATATDENGNTSEFSRNYSYPPARLANISTRGPVGTGGEILIAGFIVRPNRVETHGPRFRRKVLVRALGPSLSTGEAPFEGHLANPHLVLYDRNGAVIAENDDWKTHQQQAISETGAPPAADREAAIVAVLADGEYTAHVRGADGGIGVAIVEVFYVPMPDATSQLANISTRGHAGTGDRVLIGGVIIDGDAGQPVLIRAIGPDLASRGVSGVLEDPTLELFDASGNLLAGNEDWREDQESDITQTGLAPNDERESAIAATLIPGLYTAIVRGKNGTTGTTLVEFFDLRK